MPGAIAEGWGEGGSFTTSAPLINKALTPLSHLWERGGGEGMSDAISFRHPTWVRGFIPSPLTPLPRAGEGNTSLPINR